MFQATHLIGFGAGVLIPRFVAAATPAPNTTAGTSMTFSSQALSDEGNRHIVVAYGLQSSTASVTFSSLTVAGQSATSIISRLHSAAGNRVGITIVRLDTGATGDVVLTASHSMNRSCIAVYALYDLVSATATATATSESNTTQTLDLTCAPQGIVIGAGYNNSTGTNLAWTGLTEDSDQSSTGRFSFGSIQSLAGGSPLAVSLATGTSSPVGCSASFR